MCSPALVGRELNERKSGGLRGSTNDRAWSSCTTINCRPELEVTMVVQGKAWEEVRLTKLRNDGEGMAGSKLEMGVAIGSSMVQVR